MLTIEEIARQTNLEESLLRFYESEYPHRLPHKILRGDTLYFASEAVEAFRRIHEQHSTRIPVEKGSTRRRFGRVIGVTSGKGGVGKTNIALNLAIELQRAGQTCVVLDADLGMANVHLLAGLRPSRSLLEVVTANRAITDVLVEGPGGIGIIPGGGGFLQLADSSRQDRLKIVQALEAVEKEADIIIVDTGAGMSGTVRDFLRAADEWLFVLTPDITSLADAYGLLKALQQGSGDTPFRGPIHVLVNMVETLKQSAEVASRFSQCAKHFLCTELHHIGYIFKDATVGAATARRTPYTIFRPEARVSRCTRKVAALLLEELDAAQRPGSAFGRYLKLLEEEKVRKAG